MSWVNINKLVGFHITSNAVIDDRLFVASSVERLAIESTRRHEGLFVYEKDTGFTYQLVSGITDSDWKKKATFDQDYVHITGNETILGNKTFSNTVLIDNTGILNIRSTGNIIGTVNDLNNATSDTLVFSQTIKNYVDQHLIDYDHTLLHAKVHGISDTNNHSGLGSFVADNFMGIDSNGLPKDSGIKDSDLVHKTGVESISGNKTFSDNVYIGASGNLNIRSTGNIVGVIDNMANASGDTLVWSDTIKNYVDNVNVGLSWRSEEIVAATTTNIDLSTALENGDTIDSVTLSTGDLVLVWKQTNEEENGIYVVAASGSASRVSWMDASGEFENTAVFVQGGSTYGGYSFRCITSVTTVDTDPVRFIEVFQSTVYTAGTGIDITGTTISLDQSAIATSFLDLTDTFSSYGTAGWVVRINSTEDGLDFIDLHTIYYTKSQTDAFFTSYSGTGKAQIDWGDVINKPSSFGKIYTEGNGIDITSEVISINLDSNSGLLVSSNGLKVDFSSNIAWTNIQITGGSIEGTPIGSSSPSTGDFSSLSSVSFSSGVINVDLVQIDNSKITTNSLNQDLTIQANGTGKVNLLNVDIDGGSIDGVSIGGSSRGNGNFLAIDASTLSTISQLKVSDLTANRVVYSTTDGRLIVSDNLLFDGTNFDIVGTLKINGVTISANANELNYLDNDSLESADFQKLADISVSATKINYLSGVTGISSDATTASNNDLLYASAINQAINNVPLSVEKQYIEDYNLPGVNTTQNGDLVCNTALTEQPVSGSAVYVVINKIIRLKAGTGINDKIYFADPSDPTNTKRVSGTEQKGDKPYWNNSSDFNIESTDIIDYEYLFNSSDQFTGNLKDLGTKNTSFSVNAREGEYFSVIVSGDVEISFTNLISNISKYITLEITASGNRNITWNSSLNNCWLGTKLSSISDGEIYIVALLTKGSVLSDATISYAQKTDGSV